MSERLLSMLKKKSLKATPQRRMVLSILNDAKLPYSAEDVYDQAKTRGYAINLSTVYRVLELFLQEKLVDKTYIHHQKAHYSLHRHTHRHYLICSGCAETIEIDGCPLGSYENTVAQHTGYIITEHHVELSGLCPMCQKKRLMPEQGS